MVPGNSNLFNERSSSSWMPNASLAALLKQVESIQGSLGLASQSSAQVIPNHVRRFSDSCWDRFSQQIESVFISGSFSESCRLRNPSFGSVVILEVRLFRQLRRHRRIHFGNHSNGEGRNRRSHRFDRRAAHSFPHSIKKNRWCFPKDNDLANCSGIRTTTFIRSPNSGVLPECAGRP